MTCRTCGKPSPYVGAACTECPPPVPRVVRAVVVPVREPSWWPSGNPWTVFAVIGVVRSLGWRWTWLKSDLREQFELR